MEDATKKFTYDPIRVALFSGLMASGGATVGWLLWLSIQAFAKDWKILLAPLLGLAIGHASDWLEHYYKVSRYESKIGVWSEAEAHSEEPEAAKALKKTHTARILTITLTFLAIACEHIVNHLVQEFMLPFLASIATLFPIAALFGIALYRTEKSSSILENALMGALLGLLAGLSAWGIQLLMYGSASWGGLLGWWVLVGLVLTLCAPSKEELQPKHAMLAFGLLVGFIFVCGSPPVYRLLTKIPGPPGVAAKAVAWSVNGALQAPDLPARYWAEAESRAAEAEGRTFEDSLAPEGEPNSAPSTTTDSGTASANWLSRDTIADPNFNPVPSADELENRDLASRSHVLTSELHKGFRSGLVRSLLVLLLFILGLGYASKVEKWLRPIDYPSSRTFAHDRKLFGGMVGLIALACVLIRIGSHR